MKSVNTERNTTIACLIVCLKKTRVPVFVQWSCYVLYSLTSWTTLLIFCTV